MRDLGKGFSSSWVISERTYILPFLCGPIKNPTMKKKHGTRLMLLSFIHLNSRSNYCHTSLELPVTHKRKAYKTLWLNSRNHLFDIILFFLQLSLLVLHSRPIEKIPSLPWHGVSFAWKAHLLSSSLVFKTWLKCPLLCGTIRPFSQRQFFFFFFCSSILQKLFTFIFILTSSQTLTNRMVTNPGDLLGVSRAHGSVKSEGV